MQSDLVRLLAPAAALSTALLACGDEETPTPEPDTGADTSDVAVGDASFDTSADAGVDATVDVATDTTETDVDTGASDAADATTDIADTGPPDTADAADATADTGVDADADAGADVAVDTTPDDTCDPGAEPFGGATTIDGTEYHLLCSETHLDNVRTDPIGHFYQVADITLTAPWTPIPEFQGHLMGDGESMIHDLVIDSTESVDTGFIGWLSNGGTLESLYFANATITGARLGAVASTVVETAQNDLGKPTTPGVFVRDVHVDAQMTFVGGNGGGLFRVVGVGAEVENASIRGTVVPHESLQFMADLSGVNANFGGVTWRAQGTAQLTNVACYMDLNFGPGYARVAGIVSEAKEVDGIATFDGAVYDGTLLAESASGGFASVAHANASNVRIGGVLDVDTGQAGGLAYDLAGSFSYAVIDADLDPNDDPVSVFGDFSPTAIAYATDLGGTSGWDGNDEVYRLTRAEITDAGYALWFDFDSSVWNFTTGASPTLAFEADLPTWE